MFVKMNPLSAAPRKKSSALYVDIKRAYPCRLGFLLTMESKKISIPAKTFA